MKKNVSRMDRIIRVLLGIALIVAFLLEIAPDTIGIIFLVLGGVFILTGLIRFCPLYLPFGINTRKLSKRK